MQINANHQLMSHWSRFWMNRSGKRQGRYTRIECEPAWDSLEYQLIGYSIFGDEIIVTENSPLHSGHAVYMPGPGCAGPNSTNPDWTETILYLGPSVDEWKNRIKKYGDEYSVTPGDIDNKIENSQEYKEIYRTLNPGLPW